MNATSGTGYGLEGSFFDFSLIAGPILNHFLNFFPEAFLSDPYPP